MISPLYILVVALTISSQIEAKDYYVSNSGSDANDGSLNSPWESPQSSAYKLSAGDTLWVREGLYNTPDAAYTAVLDLNMTGTEDAWITIQAYPGETPVFALQNSYYCIICTRCSYVKLVGLEVAFQPSFYSEYHKGSAVSCDHGHHFNVTNCYVHDFMGGGINSGYCDYVYIEGNTVRNTSKHNDYGESAISLWENQNFAGITGGHYHNIVRNNIVYDNANYDAFSAGGFNSITDGNCIILDTETAGYEGATLVENNVCVDNGARCLHCFGCSNIDYFNNVCYMNDANPDYVNGVFSSNNDGELSSRSCQNVTFANNIIIPFNVNKTVTGFIDSTNVSYYNNLYYLAGNVSFFNTTSDVYGEDPLFVNPTIDILTANFSLRAESPARYRGARLLSSSDSDMLGNPRPSWNQEIDIGAYQFLTTPPSTTASPSTGADSVGATTGGAHSVGSTTGVRSTGATSGGHQPATSGTTSRASNSSHATTGKKTNESPISSANRFAVVQNMFISLTVLTILAIV